MACPPPSKPVMTVSATQEAMLAATAASAAEPPAASTSIPASTVAGCPAATAACTVDRSCRFRFLLVTMRALPLDTLAAGRRMVASAQEASKPRGCYPSRPGPPSRPLACASSRRAWKAESQSKEDELDPHQGSETGDRRQARLERPGHRVRRGADRAPHRPHQRAHRAPAHASEGPLLASRPAQARRSPAPALAVPAEAQPRGLPRPHPGARPEEVGRPEHTPTAGGWKFERAAREGR